MATGNDKNLIYKVLAGIGIVVLVIASIVTAVLLLTRGKQPDSQAQSFIFNEDFSDTSFIDTTNTDLQIDTTKGEASLFNGFWTHFTSRGLKGPEPVPGFKKASELSATAFAINPVNDEPNFIWSLKPGPVYTNAIDSILYFSRYDLIDKRWETMDGSPGREQIDFTFGSMSIGSGVRNFHAVQFDSAGNPVVAFDASALVPLPDETYIARWCPALLGGTWGDTSCTTVNATLVPHSDVHSVNVGQVLDSSDNSVVAFVDGASAYRCPVPSKRATDINGADVEAGEIIEYTVRIKNDPGTEYTAQITEDIPANVNSFTVISTPAGSTDSSLPAGVGNGANDTGYLDISNITIPEDSFVEVVYRVTLDVGLADGTVVGSPVIMTGTQDAQTKSDDVTVGSAHAPAVFSGRCHSGSWVTRYDGTAWSTPTGETVPHSDENFPGADSYYFQLAVDASDTLYLMNLERDNNLVVWKTDLTSGGGPTSWTGLDGGVNPTVLSADARISLFDIEIDPATQFPHFAWLNSPGNTIKYAYWDTTDDTLKSMDGTAGSEIIVNDISPIVPHYIALAFDPSKTSVPTVIGAPGVVLPSAVRFFYKTWDPDLEIWRTHEEQPDPEIVVHPDVINNINNLGFGINSNGDPVVGYGWHTTPGDENFYMTTYTPEAVDVDKNSLVSTEIDTTDEIIRSAKINWTGESRGYAGAVEPQAPVPFGADGRNTHIDIDCSLSNDGGQNFYAVGFDDEFVFPTKGSTLLYKCEFDSGKLLDDPILESLTVEYSIDDDNAGLLLVKDSDADGDGVYDNNGDAVVPGQVIDYRIRAMNPGNTTTQNVVVKDTLPAGVDYIPGSTAVNGIAVADIGGESPLTTPAGLNIGNVASGTFFQTDWSGGAGQAPFSDVTKFLSQVALNINTPEIAIQSTGNLFTDGNFSPNGQPVRLDTGAGPTNMQLDGSIFLQDGRLFSVWIDSATGELFGRFFDRSGNPLASPGGGTSEFQISGLSGDSVLPDDPAPVNPNDRPTVAQLSGGDIVVVWNQTASFGGGSNQIRMKRLDVNGVPQMPSKILLGITEPFVTWGADPSYIHTDYPEGFFFVYHPTKNSMVADSSNNFFLGFVHDSTGDGRNGTAKVGKFDSNGDPMAGFPVTVDGGGGVSHQGPSLSMNTAGEIAAVYSRSTDITTNAVATDIDATVINAAGAILAGPTNLFSSGIATSGTKVQQVAAYPVSTTNDFLYSLRGVGGACTAGCIQKFDSTLTSIGAPVSVDPAFGYKTAIEIDPNTGNSYVLDVDSTLGLTIEQFDSSLTSLDQIVLTPLPFTVGASLDIDPTTNTLWANWATLIHSKQFGQLVRFAPQTGELISSVYDAGASTEFTNLSVTEVVPAGTSTAYELRVGDTPTPDGSWTAFTPVTDGVPFSMTGRYAQYRWLPDNSGDLNASATLHDIAISQQAPVDVTFSVRVNQSSGLLKNTATATASNAPGTSSSNPATNAVGPTSVEEIEGGDRIDTSIELSLEQYPGNGSAGAVCVAQGPDPIDALSAAPFCSEVDGPILLNTKDKLDSRVEAEIKRVLTAGKKVYVLGREQAQAEQVLSELTAAGYNPDRIGGAERKETSALIADRLVQIAGQPVTRAFVASPWLFADALSASPVAAQKPIGGTRSPILLAGPDTISSEVKAFFDSHNDISTVVIAGGTAAVGSGIEQQLNSLSQAPTVTRVGGVDRFDTNKKFAADFFFKPTKIYVTSGYAFPNRTASGVRASSIPIDALLAGPAAAKSFSPLVLVRQELALSPYTEDLLTENNGTIGAVTFVGGLQAIFAEVRSEVLHLLQ